MGGHGALALALRNPGRYRSVSAFAPIVAPREVPWGHKAFAGYLGRRPRCAGPPTTPARWCARAPLPRPLLVDQGTADKFLDVQLKPSCSRPPAPSGQQLALRRHDGYDHSYYFIASFVDEHLAHHARALAP